MEEKQINKWLRRQFSVVGWALILYYGLMQILVNGTVLVDIIKQYVKGFAAGDFGMELDYNALMNNAWGYILTIFVGIVIFWAWKGTDYWKNGILRKKAPMRASAFFTLLTLMAGAQLIFSVWVGGVEAVMNLFGKSILDILESVSGDSDSASMFLYAAVLAPVSEEILFRVFVLRSLLPYGKRFAILGSAFLFAIFHGNILQVPYAFLAGLVLGYCAAEYSVIWSTVLHMINNLILADLLTRLMGLLPAPAADALNGVVLGGFALAAVIILIVKRREIRAYRQGEWMDRRCLKCFFLNSGVLILTSIMAISMVYMLVMA